MVEHAILEVKLVRAEVRLNGKVGMNIRSPFLNHIWCTRNITNIARPTVRVATTGPLFQGFALPPVMSAYRLSTRGNPLGMIALA